MKHILLSLIVIALVSCTQQADEQAMHASSDVNASISADIAPVEDVDAILKAIEAGIDVGEVVETAAGAAPTLAFGEVMPIVPNPDAILDQMFNVDISFVIPPEANIEDSIKAELIITPEDVDATLEHTVNGVPQEFVVLVTQIVKADIRTTDFTVTNITPEEQILLKTQSTQWLWKLEPLRPGPAEVVLTVTAIVQTDWGTTQRHMKSFEKTIAIDITKKQIVLSFIKDNWQWLWSALLVPIGLLAYKKFKKN